MTNECIFDCKYCLNRKSNDCPQSHFTPVRNLYTDHGVLPTELYRGTVLKLGIVQDPTFTMELLYRTIWLLRNHYHFNGYVHVKAIPGADPELVQRMGYLADRMSVNLELPTAEGLRTLAPNKHRKNILTPMRQIQNGIHANKEELILYRKSPHFVSGGQSTQMIIGATPETDYQIFKCCGEPVSEV